MAEYRVCGACAGKRNRILVEHAIGGVKKCRIVKERFRCRKFGFDDLVMLIACGLHNFRITMSLNLRPV